MDARQVILMNDKTGEIVRLIRIQFPFEDEWLGMPVLVVYEHYKTITSFCDKRTITNVNMLRLQRALIHNRGYKVAKIDPTFLRRR